MLGHDDEGMHEESSLTAIVEHGSLKQFRRGRDLKEAMPLCRHSCDKVSSNFLGRQSHMSSINEKPAAKAEITAASGSGA